MLFATPSYSDSVALMWKLGIYVFPKSKLRPKTWTYFLNVYMPNKCKFLFSVSLRWGSFSNFPGYGDMAGLRKH